MVCAKLHRTGNQLRKLESLLEVAGGPDLLFKVSPFPFNFPYGLGSSSSDPVQTYFTIVYLQEVYNFE